jgi:hypothetical protein
LVLGTIGVGLAAAVLLVGASVNNIVSQQAARSQAADTSLTKIAGVAPLDYVYGGTTYRDTEIEGRYVRATGPNSPIPPGLSRLPGPNQVVVSPALAALLDSPGGALLRPRFPRVVGRITQAGLHGPQDLFYYAGIPASELGTADPLDEQVYSFGEPPQGRSLGNSALLALLVVGVVALMVPILIMISISSRIAGAARDRRLAALRLVGAGARQVRRIAAAEALVPAATGLVLGALVFLLFRQIAPRAHLFGISVFTSDVAVPWPLVVVIVVLVPVLAVGSSMVALRRTVIEPLGVVRGGRPVSRRLWWRVVLVAAGVGFLIWAAHLPSADNLGWIVVVGLGASLLLIGVPVLLPFLLERGAGAIRGGAPSWQLAIRRLQLDSGTPARVVGGVAVVLAGAIALQAVVVATSFRLAVPDTNPTNAAPGSYYVITDSGVIGQVDDAIRRTGVATSVDASTVVSVTTNKANPYAGGSGDIVIASCATIQHTIAPVACRDGDVFSQAGMGPAIRPGTRLTAVRPQTGPNDAAQLYGDWTVPTTVRPLPTRLVSERGPGASLTVTPGAIRGVVLPPRNDVWALVRLDLNRQDAVEYLRDALAPYPIRTQVESLTPSVAVLNADQRTFVQTRTGLLIGSLFTLLLASVSLLVLALEQVRERRRPLAMLSASGVPRGVLARSLLWQIAIPVGIGVVAAVGTGLALAVLVLRITHTRVVLDWSDVGLFSGAAVLLVLLVSAATLPALRNATRLAALRTE